MENEFKFIIPNASIYEKLLAYLGGNPQTFIQENHYFWPANLMLPDHPNVMMRIRVETNKIAVAYKRRRQQINGFFCAEEFEAELDRQITDEILNGTKNLSDVGARPVEEALMDFGAVKFQHLGFIINKRIDIVFYGNVISIDKVNFQDGSCDYELEMEIEDTSNNASAFLSHIFQEAHIVATPQTETKFDRFLRKGVKCQ